MQQLHAAHQLLKLWQKKSRRNRHLQEGEKQIPRIINLFPRENREYSFEDFSDPHSSHKAPTHYIAAMTISISVSEETNHVYRTNILQRS